jgi:hypothetical protein
LDAAARTIHDLVEANCESHEYDPEVPPVDFEFIGGSYVAVRPYAESAPTLLDIDIDIDIDIDPEAEVDRETHFYRMMHTGF